MVPECFHQFRLYRSIWPVYVMIDLGEVMLITATGVILSYIWIMVGPQYCAAFQLLLTAIVYNISESM